LQLRSHGQLLTHFKLERRFHILLLNPIARLTRCLEYTRLQLKVIT